jgi:hypothetical protein
MRAADCSCRIVGSHLECVKTGFFREPFLPYFAESSSWLFGRNSPIFLAVYGEL